MAGALDGKVALVAGGTRGAGRGIAVELGAAGAARAAGDERHLACQRSGHAPTLPRHP